MKQIAAYAMQPTYLKMFNKTHLPFQKETHSRVAKLLYMGHGGISGPKNDLKYFFWQLAPSCAPI